MPYHLLILGTMLMVPLSIFATPPEPHAPSPRAVLDMDKLPQHGETLVWSPLFQATWDKMQSFHAGKLEKVDPANPVITALEQFKWKEAEVMPKDGYAVFAGPDTPDFTKKTAVKIKERFNVDLPTRIRRHNPLANAYYGVLVRDLAFKKQFYRSKKQGLMFKDYTGSKYLVQFFGTAKHNSGGYAKNIRILANDPDSKTFIISMATHLVDEKIIIYRPSKSESIATAIQHTLTARNNPCDGKFMEPTYPYLVDGDIVKIPYLTINFRSDLTNLLKGIRYYKGDPKPWFISWAYQVTDFQLTEKGARVRLQTGMSDAFGGAPKPRELICDEPFFVFAWRDKAPLPYFAAWIDGKAALKLFTK